MYPYSAGVNIGIVNNFEVRVCGRENTGMFSKVHDIHVLNIYLKDIHSHIWCLWNRYAEVSEIMKWNDDIGIILMKLRIISFVNLNPGFQYNWHNCVFILQFSLFYFKGHWKLLEPILNLCYDNEWRSAVSLKIFFKEGLNVLQTRTGGK